MSARKATLLFCMILTLLLPLVSCSYQNSITPEEAVNAMCQAEKPLPVGKIYVRSATEESDKAISDTLLASLFGNGTLPPEFDSVSDAAFFFSYTHPCEFAAFLCKSTDDTTAVAALCHRRLDTLRSVRSSPEDLAYLEHATVAIHANYVFLCVSADPATALKAVKKL